MPLQGCHAKIRLPSLLCGVFGLVHPAALILLLTLSCGIILALPARAWAQTPGLHTAPVVIFGSQIRAATGRPLTTYRLYKSGSNGRAEPIPFQIDELNLDGDYVLDQGSAVTANSGNGLFDLQDELALMGDDIGPAAAPTDWGVNPPNEVFEIQFDYRGMPMPPAAWAPDRNKGAVYLAVFHRNPPAPASKTYVVFDRGTAEVKTSRYRYGFDQKNWLVSRKVEMRNPSPQAKPEFLPILDSTTFFMRADLKYFLTFEANHNSVSSELEAYKIGPVRSIIRITYYYTLLRLNFELGMYTEISFFSNAIFLPAILYNPIDGPKALNSGSGFYYGLALKDNPRDYKIETNMQPWQPSGFLNFLKSPFERMQPMYWLSATGTDRMLYMEMTPSAQMNKLGAAPTFYREDRSGEEIKPRNNDRPNPLGRSPVNLGLNFDLTKFSEGDHLVGFKMYVDNLRDERRLESYKLMNRWGINAQRIR
ncbi:MAG: hypothetical protein RIQ81_1319 [Pseudomonadota bacterium]